MQRIDITSGLSFSRIVYGMWRIGDDADTSPRHVQAKIEACLEQGITTMDQADIYGGYTAEAILGGGLREAPSLRDKIEIVTKCGIVAPAGRHSAARVKHYDTSAKHINESVEASLRDMNTDRIDLLLIHRPDPMLDPEETGEALDALVTSGKVKSVGVSNFRPWDFSLLQSNMTEELVTNQIEISLAETSPFTNGDLAYLQERDLPIMAWSPLGGGSLMGKEGPLADALERIARENNVDTAAVAVAWLLAHPAKILPVMGTNNLARIATISKANEVKMDRQTWFELYTLANGREVP
ncbi:aldo/keto reductase [Agrobacterium larrymoorei]|uniref:Aldo/keto reductase n=1 Tax=Agrobacterium larrymoorei TaxID=160699 RepID=A0A4D7DQK2_9HYPH|nr:aldo/keto reductase [Agrobacterium larrymoorei]QCI99653.1 oxidoreductase [Agrobacterium larrymoorei]QYA09916.1 aldo/keto reductase [Agrobacterium larrymoorei]